MLVLSRSREQTARHEPTVVPDAGVTDKPAVMPDILISIPEASMPIAAVVAEITVKKSVFRAEVFYTDNAQEAKETVKRQKDQYRDARHVVHAFVIGESGAVLGCSDDGEPAGTAGQPVLAVLKGSGITNILVTVTRWFGGTLLGTGGLVKAYSTAAKEALAKVHTEPLIQKAEFTCECSYENHNPLLRAAAHLPISFAQTEFAQTVRLSGSIPLEYCNELAQLVTEITKGASSVRFSE
ncbi:YigZ family protein [Treponema sp. OMZ 906]|nr:YigZ family protein [Treponema sp. OMZ 906]UTC54433.1 YigZ family protein [Treponema sp. OMZ 906]